MRRKPEAPADRAARLRDADGGRSWIPLQMQAVSAPSILDPRPGLVRIEALHLLELLKGVRPKVLLIDHAAVTDYERLDAAAVVLRGSRHQRKASDHHAFDDEVHGTVRGGG